MGQFFFGETNSSKENAGLNVGSIVYYTSDSGNEGLVVGLDGLTIILFSNIVKPLVVLKKVKCVAWPFSFYVRLSRNHFWADEPSVKAIFLA